jgi:CarD family transcriptional regulator
MFKINYYVVYGSTGVCEVKDIKSEKDNNNEEIEYYILNPVYDRRMTIKTPVLNRKVYMRDIMTREDVSLLIDKIADNEIISIENTRERTETFKNIIRNGESDDLIKVINTIKIDKEEKLSIGKKLNKTEEDIMLAAKKKLYEEFAIVLDIPVENVSLYIKEKIS